MRAADRVTTGYAPLPAAGVDVNPRPPRRAITFAEAFAAGADAYAAFAARLGVTPRGARARR